MMTQSVMTQAANLFAHASGSVTFKGKQTGNDFSLLLGNSMNTARSIAGNSDTVAVAKTSAQTDKTKSSVESDSADPGDVQTKAVQTDKPVNTAKTNTAKESAVKASDAKTDNAKTDNAKAAASENTNTDRAEDMAEDEELLAQIQAMLQSVGQAVMEQLNLSPEEFNQLLTDQGLSLQDLLQPENLQQLILANSGKTDILAFLTDENLADTMKQLLQTVQAIADSHNIGLTPDQIKSLLEQVKAQPITQSEADKTKTVNNADDMTASVNEADNQQKTKNVTQEASNSQDKGTAGTSEHSVAMKETSAASSEKSGNAAYSDSNNRSDKNLNTSDRFQTFVDNLVKASQNLQTDFVSEMTQVTKLRDIANQIIERIKVSVTAGKTSMELALNPESLGKVNLSVQSKDGVLTAHFVVQNQVTKEAIESQLQTLRDTLHQQGVKVEAIEVTVSANAFDQNYSQGSENDSQAKESNSGKKISLDDALQMTEASEDELNLNDHDGTSGSVIDYTA